MGYVPWVRVKDLVGSTGKGCEFRVVINPSNMFNKSIVSLTVAA